MGIFGKIKNDLSKTFPPKADQPRAGKNIFKSPSASLRVNKRFFVIILLFFVLSGIIFPKTANAIPWWISPAGWFLGDATTNAFANTVSFIFAGGPLFLTAFIADLMYAILMIVVGWTQTIKYGSSDAVMLGWPIVRDFANMFVVLGLVVIGLATILRFHDYEAKKLLPKLIIAALLINFSLVICGVFIDGSNIITNYFFTKGQSGLSLFTQNLQKALNLISIESLWKDNFMAYSAKIYSLVFFNFISIIIFLLYGAMLLFRIVALYILVILSPLAFVAAVFPGKPQEFYKMWKNNFMQWCIIGIPAGLFYYIGSNMMQKATTTPLNFDGSLMSIEAIVNKVSSFASLIFIPSAFLIIGFLFALKTSAMGADIITSRANKAWGGIKKYAGTGAKAGAKYAGGKIAGATGVAGLYNKAKSTVTETLEKAGAIPYGTDRRKKAEVVDKYLNDAKYMTQEERKKIAASSPIDEEGKNRKAAIIKHMTENGELNNIPVADRQNTIDYAKSRGVQASVFTKADPHQARNDPDTYKNIAETDLDENLKLANRGTMTFEEAQKRQAVRNAFKNSNVGKIKDFSTDTVKGDVVDSSGNPANYKPESFIENTPASRIESAAKDMSPAQITALKATLPYIESQMAKAMGDPNWTTWKARASTDKSSIFGSRSSREKKYYRELDKKRDVIRKL